MNTDHTVGDDQDLGELCKNCALAVFVLMGMRLLVMVKMMSFYDNANDFFIGHTVPLCPLFRAPCTGAPQGVVLSQVPHCDLRLQHLLLWR